MKINLDESNKITALIPGLFKFDEDGLFSQAALALTEKELFIYDDHRPTDKNNGVYHYVIKKRYKLSHYSFVLDEKLKSNTELSNYGRLYFYSDDEGECFEFYYMVNDMKKVKDFLKNLKNQGIPNAKRTTSIKSDGF